MARAWWTCFPTLFVLILSILQTAAGTPRSASQAVLVSKSITSLSPYEEGRQLVFLDAEKAPAGKALVQCLRIDLQPDRWSWKQLIWGAMEASVSLLNEDQPSRSQRQEAEPEGRQLLKQALGERQDNSLNWLESDKEGALQSHGGMSPRFFVGLVPVGECTGGAEVNATVICKGGDGVACVLHSQSIIRSCICAGLLESGGLSAPNGFSEGLQSGIQSTGGASSKILSAETPTPKIANTEGTPTPTIANSEVQLPRIEETSEGHSTPPDLDPESALRPITIQINASVKVPQLSMLLTAMGLLLLSSAEPLSRVSAMHIILGGLLGAGLAHIGVMLAIAAVPGAVVALPWIAALSAYRLGICEALAMLVAGEGTRNSLEECEKSLTSSWYVSRIACTLELVRCSPFDIPKNERFLEIRLGTARCRLIRRARV
jgi:hypothetical protein